MSFTSWLKNELRESKKFWLTPPIPKGVKRGKAKEWRVVVTQDNGDRWTVGEVKAIAWVNAMTKARRMVKKSGRKDISRIQVKVKR